MPSALRLLTAGAALAALAACASPTPYQPALDRYGYSEQQIEDNRYRVTFAGNSATPRETVQNYLLFRAAEITLASGHDYFSIVEQDIEATGSGVAGPRVGVGVGGGGNFGIGVGLSTLLGGGGSSASYTAYADILVLDGEKPESDTRSYNARDVITRLRPEIVPAEG